MRRNWRIGLAWLAATALSVLIASAAVAGIRDRVVETPVAIGLPTTTTTTLAPDGVTSTSSPAGPTTSATSSTTTSTTTTTTTVPQTATTVLESTSTTTTAPPVSTTTTTAPPQTTTTLALTNETYTLIGGTVILSFGDGEVHLVSAAPRPGFSADHEHTGPKEVEIKFESNDHKSKLEAKYKDGELKVDIEEEPHDSDDD